MKGTFFQKPLELSLKVEGESWSQGDAISGSLEVKNHGGDPVALSDIHVHLGHALLRKVRAKDPDAFKLLATAPDGSGTVAAGASAQVAWKFQTQLNCPVTDNVSSPFLVYGLGESQDKLGNLQIPVQPAPLIQEFLKALTIQYRFVVKSQKSSKSGVEVKLEPPTAKGFSSLEQLVTYFRFEGDALEVRYVFHVKKVAAGPANTEVGKDKKETEQSFTPLQYRLPSGRFNYEALEKGIREALDLVENKAAF